MNKIINPIKYLHIRGKRILFQNFARLIFIISSYIFQLFLPPQYLLTKNMKKTLLENPLQTHTAISSPNDRPFIQRYVTKQLYRAYVIVAYN